MQLATPEITVRALNKHRRLGMDLSQANIMATSMKTIKLPYHLPILTYNGFANKIQQS